MNPSEGQRLGRTLLPAVETGFLETTTWRLTLNGEPEAQRHATRTRGKEGTLTGKERSVGGQPRVEIVCNHYIDLLRLL